VSLSVHVLAVNAADVVGRAVRSLSGVSSEVVLVDAGSSDGTPEVAEAACREVGAAFRCVSLSPLTHPELFMRDEPSTWRREVPGPFTGLHVLRRFDLARNLGLDQCSCSYVAKLDADDEVLDPAGIVKACRFLGANPRVEVVMCPYDVVGEGGEFPYKSMLYDRLWRNTPGARFTQAVHEYLCHKRYVGDLPNWAVTEMGRTRDHRDSRGVDSRVPRRNYKVFLAEYERREVAGEPMDPRFLLSTIDDVGEVDPGFAAQLRLAAAKA
jgi:glycosyltransferase involved in cell wall biosynthesis